MLKIICLSLKSNNSMLKVNILKVFSLGFEYSWTINEHSALVNSYTIKPKHFLKLELKFVHFNVVILNVANIFVEFYA